MLYLRHVYMDSGSRSSLDLFLLGLIQTGINTPYLFRERAHLSVGATLPALKRLVASGCVKQAEKAARNKREFELTATGKRALRSGVDELVREFRSRPPGDIESILRVAALARTKSSSSDAATVLKSAATDRKHRSNQLSAPKLQTATDLASIYSNFLASCQAAAFAAEADALANLASAVSRPVRKNAKRTSQKKTSS